MATFDTTSGLNYINLLTNEIVKPRNIRDHYHKINFTDTLFDNMPDYVRSILFMPRLANGNKYYAMFQIKVDGYIHVRGIQNTDQDISIIAANSVLAATIDIIPQQYDRFLLTSFAGNGYDHGAGIIQVYKNHPWIYYGFGNDPTRWAITFIPCKNSPGTTVNDFLTIVDGKPTLNYPLYGQLKYCLQAKNGNRILFSKPWKFKEDRSNHPNDLRTNGLNTNSSPFDVYFNNGVARSDKLFKDITSITLPIIYNGFLSGNYLYPKQQIYKLMQYVTTTIKGSDKKDYRVTRYFYIKEKNGLNSTSTTNAWNLVRIGNNSIKTAYYKIDNLIILQIADPNNANNHKFRIIHNFSYLDRALVSGGNSYTYRNIDGNIYIAGSKISMCRVCTIVTIKTNFVSSYLTFIRAGDTEVWKILSITKNESNNKYTLKYLKYSIPKTGGMTKTVNTKSSDGNFLKNDISASTKYTVYQYDSIKNPHPVQGSFPSVWAFQSVTSGEAKYYIWGFKHQYTAISPTVNFSDYQFLYSNTNKVIPPSLLPQIVSSCFGKSWTLYHSYANNNNYNYMNTNSAGSFEYETNISKPATLGLRKLKSALSYVYSWNEQINGLFGSHTNTVFIPPPENNNDGGLAEVPGA